ncbi:MAG: winged helix-turn-helix transcriptional regulator [Rhizobiales bacterium]|nr:winged helix-turn-helix transcriptional regulator [Hyphomicrobiales bacterium]
MIDDMVNDIDGNHAKLSDAAKPTDIAPAIGAASRAVIAAMMTRLAARGFDGMTPAFAGLIPLLDATGARPTTLAQRAGVSKQAMSQLLHEIEARGYVEQVPDPTDTRAKIVRLNKRGVALREACLVARGELQALAKKNLGQTRLAALQRDLLQLSAAFKQSRQN